MDLCFTRGRHSPLVSKIFGNDLDAFLREDVLGALFGDRWESILCVDGVHAMLHTFVPAPIRNTTWHDIEPWFGYAGPIFNYWTPEFAKAALDVYQDACRSRGIVAELIRFQPDRQNHIPFRGLDGIVLHEGPLIAYVPIIDGNDEAQFAIYSPPCRRQVRSARHRLFFKRLGRSSRTWLQFIELYRESLNRNSAARRWFLDDAIFHRLRQISPVSLWGVFSDSQGRELLSAALVIAAREIVHTLFVANAHPQRLRGAHDLLTHCIVREFQGKGYRWVCLGGGRSSSPEDSLLAFKRKFGPRYLRPLPMGFLVHDQEALEILCARAASQRPMGESRQPSIELLSRFMPYRLVPSFGNPDALPETTHAGATKTSP